MNTQGQIIGPNIEPQLQRKRKLCLRKCGSQSRDSSCPPAAWSMEPVARCGGGNDNIYISEIKIAAVGRIYHSVKWKLAAAGPPARSFIIKEKDQGLEGFSWFLPCIAEFTI